MTTRTRLAIEQVLRSSLDVEVRETIRRGHATELAREAAGEGYDAVVVFAGDGTLNEAADGLAGTATALAPLPGGSTNVFARTMGVAFDPITAALGLVDSFAAHSFRRVGLGMASPSGGDRRRFLFHLGVGFDAAVIRRMEQRTYLKRYFAHPAFALAALDTWLRHYDRRSVIRLEIRGNCGVESVTGPYAVISNSDPYTYVGRRRMTIAPGASLARPLAVTVLENLGARLLVRAAASAVGNGTFMGTAPQIAQVTDVTSVTITAEPRFPWQVDGDYLGEVDRLDVTYEPDALTLVVPVPLPEARSVTDREHGAHDRERH